MEVYPHSAKTYSREARDALQRLSEGKDADDIHRSLITFLNATKYTIQQLQTDFKSSVGGFDEWYSSHKDFLINNSICKFFWVLRNRVTKEGENVLMMKFLEFHIIPGKSNFPEKGPFLIGPDVGFLKKTPKGDGFEHVPIKNIDIITPWEFIDYPGEDPICLCAQYLDMLDNVVDSFIKRFSTK